MVALKPTIVELYNVISGVNGNELLLDSKSYEQLLCSIFTMYQSHPVNSIPIFLKRLRKLLMQIALLEKAPDKCALGMVRNWQRH